jgi:hypothetical protein
VSIHAKIVQTPEGVAEYDVVICDGCGAERTLLGLAGWVSVDALGLDISMMSDPQLPRHACSLTCTQRSLERLSWLKERPLEAR